MGNMDFSHFYSGFISVPSAILCWMEYSVFKQSVPKLLSLTWSHVCQRQIPTSYKKNRFCSKQKRLRFNFSGGIRLWGPVMAFYRPFVVGWQDRVALLEQCSTPGPRSIEHCSTLLSNAHWIFKNTPNPSGSFLNRRFYIHVVSFSSFFLIFKDIYLGTKGE